MCRTIISAKINKLDCDLCPTFIQLNEKHRNTRRELWTHTHTKSSLNFPSVRNDIKIYYNSACFGGMFYRLCLFDYCVCGPPKRDLRFFSIIIIFNWYVWFIERINKTLRVILPRRYNTRQCINVGAARYPRYRKIPPEIKEKWTFWLILSVFVLVCVYRSAYRLWCEMPNNLIKSGKSSRESLDSKLIHSFRFYCMS